eukprot:EG_transcript_6975
MALSFLVLVLASFSGLLCFARGTPALSIVPDTTASGVTPTHWTVTLRDINAVPAGVLNFLYWSTIKPVFAAQPTSKPEILVGACRCTVPEITSTTMMVWLPNDCGLGTAVLFTVPAAYLGANPEGEVSVMLTAGTNSLRTTIAYSRAPAVSIVPNTLVNGAQPAYWTVTVRDLAAIVPGHYNSIYWSSSKPLFANPDYPPDVDIAGCHAAPMYCFATTLMLLLPPACGLGGTFSFAVPADYLAANPGGSVAVMFSIGASQLRTVVAYTADSPSPSLSPKASPSSPGTPVVLSVVPDTLSAGVQPTHWTVTVSGLQPVAPRALQSIYLATCCVTSSFVATSSAKPVGLVGVCAATATATTRAMLIYLPDACGLGSGVSFTIPAAFLAPNPGGNVSVFFSVGGNDLWTTVVYSGDSSRTVSLPVPPPPSSLQKPEESLVIIISPTLLVSILSGGLLWLLLEVSA